MSPVNRMTPDILFDSIESHFDDEGLPHGVNLWVIEVMAHKTNLLILHISRFDVFTMNNFAPFEIDASETTLESELQAFLQFYSDKFPPHTVFMQGEVFEQRPSLSQLWYNWLNVNSRQLTNDWSLRLPLVRNIEAYIADQFATIPMEIELIALDTSPITPSTKPGQIDLNRIPLSFECEAQKVVISGVFGREYVLYAPYLNMPFKVFFSELSGRTRTPRQHRIYTVIATTKQEFRVRLVFTGDNWSVDWGNEVREVDVFIDHDPRRYSLSVFPVTVDISQPKLLVVIQGTLGMNVLSKSISHEELPPDPATNFDTLKAFVSRIIGMFHYWHSAILFYNDYHPEHRFPAEFGWKGQDHVPKEEHVIRFLSDKEGFFHYDALVPLIDRDFMQHQTIAVDWNKSLEVALKTINDLDWEGGLVIFIGQCPPHRSAREQNEAQFGFVSDIDFDAELERLNKQQAIKRVSLFLSEDIPSSALKREARRYWERLASEESLFFEGIVVGTDTDPQDMFTDKLFDMLTELDAWGQPTVNIQTVNDQHALNLPLTTYQSTWRIKANLKENRNDA